MKILYLHGRKSAPDGLKPTFLATRGHVVISPRLPPDDFESTVRIARETFERNIPDVVVGASRGAAAAMNIDSGNVPLVLLCPAWRNWGTATTVKRNTIILHSRNDQTVPFFDSRQLVENSGLPPAALIDVGLGHRLIDADALAALANACEKQVRKTDTIK